MSAVYTIPEIKNIVCPLAKEYGAERVYLFGSYARNCCYQDDLLLDLEKALGCSVDLITTTSLDKDFLSSIKNDEVLLYEAS